MRLEPWVNAEWQDSWSCAQTTASQADARGDKDCQCARFSLVWFCPLPLSLQPTHLSRDMYIVQYKFYSNNNRAANHH